MSIVFLAPDDEMAKTARRISRLFQEKVLVVKGLLREAIPIARQMEEQGAEVIVARGGTALLLKREGIRSPIVELALTSKDIVEALGEAREKSGLENPCIGVVAFPNMIQNLLDFLPFLNVNVRCYSLTLEENAPELVRAAVKDGAQVLLGGVITTKIAMELHLPAVLLRSRESALRQAFEEAQRIAYARRLESRRSNELKAMLEYAYEGIVAVDSEGRVTVFNPVAEHLTGVKREDALGTLARNSIPSIRFDDILESGSEDIGQLADFGRSKIMVSRIPIRVGGQIVGAVATFEDVTRIQSMEERIRQEIYSKGHVAKFRFQDIGGTSPALVSIIATAKRYSQVDSTILIHGETGVGKELVAQSIHNESGRSGGPFVAVNCAALPENLLESELFGYVEGAFTGARRKGKPGLFELAHHGTIFDEVSEIPLSLQGRLLRVLQEREVIRLGHDRVIPVDVRVLCATNRDVHTLVEEGKFRKDLYWRLNVLSLTIPPLRERKGDVMFLTSHFLHGIPAARLNGVGFTEDAASFLENYSWPGNVRELRNFCERLAVLQSHESASLEFVKWLLEYREDPLSPAPCGMIVDETEIRRVLSQTAGKKARAAEILGVHRTTLWRRMKRLSLGRARP